MDIARPSNARKKRIRQTIYAGVGLLVVGLVSVGLSRLKPAAPTVERAVVWPDTVKRGPMVRQVRGLGTLTPEDIRWIPATTQGRVEKIILRPGTQVKADDVILELTNPQLEQQLQDADAEAAGGAKPAWRTLKVQLQQRPAAAARGRGQHRGRLQQGEDAGADERGAREGSARLRAGAEAVAGRRRVSSASATRSRRSSSRARPNRCARSSPCSSRWSIRRARCSQLTQQQRDELKVRAGLDGMLQLVPVEVGQQVAPGTNLARVANPSRLKAEIKIAETQAKDIQLGQKAEVDTRNGIVEGRVARIDPSVQNGTRTVDVTLTGDLPKGAVPDLSVDGTIELERLNDVALHGASGVRPGPERRRPVQDRRRTASNAERVQVKLGRSSVNTIEVLSGLKVGDQVILSDMSAYDAYDRIRLK